jgi:hypothetical protein
MQKEDFWLRNKELRMKNLLTQAARISRKATSIALKCSLSKQLLDDLEKAIEKLNLEADNLIIQVQEKAKKVPLVSTDCSADTLTGKITFRVPRMVKGSKTKRSTISLEKRKEKKNKSGKNKGNDPTNLVLYPLCAIVFIVCFNLYC